MARILIAGMVGAAIAAGVATAAPARADELSLAHFMPPRHPMHVHVFAPLAEQVAAATEGEMTIEIYPAGELGAGPREQLSRAVDGIADLTFGLPGYTSALFPRVLALELPGLFDSNVEATAFAWDNIDLFRSDFQRVEMLGLWANHPAVILTTETPIRTLEDLEGLSIRAPSATGAATLAAWGANPITMPVADVYTALLTGVLDGVMIGPDGIGSFRLNEVTSYVTANIPGGITTFFLVANRDRWADLDDATRQQVADLVYQAVSLSAAEAYETAGRDGLAIVDADDGTEVILLSDEEVARFRAASAAVIDDYIAGIDADGVDGQAIRAAFDAR